MLKIEKKIRINYRVSNSEMKLLVVTILGLLLYSRLKVCLDISLKCF